MKPQHTNPDELSRIALAQALHALDEVSQRPDVAFRKFERQMLKLANLALTGGHTPDDAREALLAYLIATIAEATGPAQTSLTMLLLLAPTYLTTEDRK